MEISPNDIAELTQRAQALAQEMRSLGDDTLAFDSLLAGIHDFEQSEDMAVDVLLPTESAAAGFLRLPSAKAFFSAIVCRDDRVREEIRTAVITGPQAVVATVIGLLTVGVGAVITLTAISAIIVGIVALLITRGLDGACEEASK